MKTYDLIIIGGGSAGLAAALQAEKLKIKSLLINAGLPLGGTCLNVGCIPSKRFLYIAQLIAQTNADKFKGLTTAVKKVNFKQIVADTNQLIAGMQKENYEIVKNLKHVTYLQGYARFTSNFTITINNTNYKGTKFILATGSTTTVPHIPGIRETNYITHVEALQLPKIPKSLVIIGAGAIGTEFAQMYARFGSKVTILEQSPAIHCHTDATLTDKLSELLQLDDITIHAGVSVTNIKQITKNKTITFKKQNRLHTIDCDQLMLATGKTPNTKKLNLETVHVQTNEKQAIVVNEFLQTNKAHIFAAGDVIAAPLRIETTAAQEGKIAVDNAINESKESINYQEIPFSLFTDPELAYVGLQECDIKNKNEYVILTESLANLPKAKIVQRQEGIVKLIVHKKSRQIKGVHLLCAGAADIIAQAAALIKNKNTIDDLLQLTPVYPTFSEALKWLVRQYEHAF